jgi:hypothetical protein
MAWKVSTVSPGFNGVEARKPRGTNAPFTAVATWLASRPCAGQQGGERQTFGAGQGVLIEAQLGLWLGEGFWHGHSLGEPGSGVLV